MNRDELIAEMVAGYREELSQLTDRELYEHWKLQKGVSEMTPGQWAQIYKQVGPKQK